MAKNVRAGSREISRRALVSKLSTDGLLFLGSACLISSQARASQDCTPQADLGRAGLRVMPRPAGRRRVVETDCMPHHAVGPYFASGVAPQPTAMQFYFSANPTAEPRPTPVGTRMFGVAVNGTPFESVAPSHAASAHWQYNVLSPQLRAFFGFDANNGHVYPNGQYHYVGSPTGLVCSLLDELQINPGASTPMLLLGWAADGFPIYADISLGPLVDDGTPLAHTLFRSSYRLKSGPRPEASPGGVFDGTFVQDYEFVQGAGDLDECNGRFGATLEYPGGTYYYVITRHFPFLPLAFCAKPDSSFATRSGPMALPASLVGYAGRSLDASAPLAENPESDASLLGLPAGLASAQQPLVMDYDGYRYFMSICSLDGKLYYSSTSIASRELVSSWQMVANQASFATNRPDLVMLSHDRFQVSVRADVAKLEMSVSGSLAGGTIHFETWRSTL